MNHSETCYLDLLQKLVYLSSDPRSLRKDRTGVGTYSIFGYQLRFPVKSVGTNTFRVPILTTKKIHYNSVLAELLWMISGNTSVHQLHEHKVTIWDEWADEAGNLGKIYGYQWRNFNGQGIDQIKRLVEGIKSDPMSRRHIVSAWNPAQIGEMALPPCHSLFQFFVSSNGKLSCQLYQRSADVFLGLPFNIASYSTMLCLISSVCELEPEEFIVSIGDAHLYANHITAARTQILREPFEYPVLKINPRSNIFDFVFEDFTLEQYNHHSKIKAQIAV